MTSKPYSKKMKYKIHKYRYIQAEIKAMMLIGIADTNRTDITTRTQPYYSKIKRNGRPRKNKDYITYANDNANDNANVKTTKKGRPRKNKECISSVNNVKTTKRGRPRKNKECINSVNNANDNANDNANVKTTNTRRPRKNKECISSVNIKTVGTNSTNKQIITPEKKRKNENVNDVINELLYKR